MKQSPRNTTLSPVNRTDVPLSQETQKVVVVTCGITINNLIPWTRKNDLFPCTLPPIQS